MLSREMKQSSSSSKLRFRALVVAVSFTALFHLLFCLLVEVSPSQLDENRRRKNSSFFVISADHVEDDWQKDLFSASRYFYPGQFAFSDFKTGFSSIHFSAFAPPYTVNQAITIDYESLGFTSVEHRLSSAPEDEVGRLVLSSWQLSKPAMEKVELIEAPLFASPFWRTVSGEPLDFFTIPAEEQVSRLVPGDSQVGFTRIRLSSQAGFLWPEVIVSSGVAQLDQLVLNIVRQDLRDFLILQRGSYSPSLPYGLNQPPLEFEIDWRFLRRDN